MEKVVLLDGNEVKIDAVIYEKIAQVIINAGLGGRWLTYGEIFPVLKPTILEEVAAGVWNFRGVFYGLIAEDKISIKEEDNEIYYYIK